jgi:shikimate kinase
MTDRGQRPVALCGFMGSGKSSIGRRVAEALHRPLYDSDVVVEERLGRSIAELFSSGEEARFRAMEAAVVADLVEAVPPGVISLGGGALENPVTRALVLEHTAAVYLDRPLAQILASLDRLRRNRPLLRDRSDEQIAALYDERTTTYEQCPIIVDVGEEGLDEVTRRVLEALFGAGISRPGDE